MQNAIFNWFANNYPELIGCIIVAIIVWFIAKFYFFGYKKVEDKVKNLPCERNSINLNEINSKLDRIITYLTTKYPTSASVFSFKQSPRCLNDRGNDLLHQCGGDYFLEKNAPLFIEMIAASNPKTALDVESQAYEVLIASQNLEAFNEIKQWVYNSPSWELDSSGNKEPYSITMGDICFVLSIPLRDKYLAEHPEVSTEE